MGRGPNPQGVRLGIELFFSNKSSDDTEAADILLNDAPNAFYQAPVDKYAFVAAPGEYALSYFDVKVARSIRQKD